MTATASVADTAAKALEPFGARSETDFGGGPMFAVAPDKAKGALIALRDHPELRMVFLSDLTCVDYLSHSLKPVDTRFGVIYLLYSFHKNARMRLKAYVPDARPELPTVGDLWGCASWLEREVYDLFGVTFSGHPDLRRILMPSGYTGHPLRKDYPLRGRGERSNFPKYTP